MSHRMPFTPSPEVAAALAEGKPIVALESTIISHGLPRPQNLEVAREVEDIVRDHGAVPATIAVIDGVVHIGLTDDQLKAIANRDDIAKASSRDLAIISASKKSAATTVAATAHLAALAGIRVFATGGLGGVHRDASAEVQEDIPVLIFNTHPEAAHWRERIGAREAPRDDRLIGGNLGERLRPWHLGDEVRKGRWPRAWLLDHGHFSLLLWIRRIRSVYEGVRPS